MCYGFAVSDYYVSNEAKKTTFRLRQSNLHYFKFLSASAGRRYGCNQAVISACQARFFPALTSLSTLPFHCILK
ncbi:hypothetical protein SY86_03595 [Erwinia tracheiphila]|uniref:Uncharacterized protein n=1 Tax=Erwinia tracheiphila TaxID=65700 RepID=A0A0M2KBQ5_9GAMM|nr:hypothetical protein ETR_00715 [Erwinia tracheiphila PSU-1]KKF34717.1 hypothetical protein SY86_03595 [Erwinia tracheiphila]